MQYYSIENKTMGRHKSIENMEQYKKEHNRRYYEEHKAAIKDKYQPKSVLCDVCGTTVSNIDKHKQSNKHQLKLFKQMASPDVIQAITIQVAKTEPKTKKRTPKV